MSVAPAAVTNKTALNLLGHAVGRPRLPYVEADERELATIRAMLSERGLLVGATA
jgi:4-hydroxy-tetrahydrodipicolinate synthase